MQARSNGADIRIIQSPLEAYRIALEESSRGTKFDGKSGRQVVLFAIGFETTAPATAMAIRLAQQSKLDCFSALVCHVLVPPALEAIFSDPLHGIDGLLAAGHVCTIAGYRPYEAIAERHCIPIAITGFEPVDLLRGILAVIEQLQASRSKYSVVNSYEHIAGIDGNSHAQTLVDEVFEINDQLWRGIGSLPSSGLKLREPYASFDANHRFEFESVAAKEPSICRAADVLRGKIRPIECPEFGKKCNPSNPIGAPMVSNEGACAAYYLYQSLAVEKTETLET
jgi:hydrogenase expression/formation protein HypD